ncbi:hypothetical protein [Micromonospora arida]
MPTVAPAGDCGGAVAVPTSTSRPSRKASRITPAQEPVAPACTTPPQVGTVQSMCPLVVSDARLAPMRYTPTPRTPSTCGWLCPAATAAGPRAEAGAVPPARGAAAAGSATVAGTSVPSANAAVVRRIAGRFMVAPSVMGLLPS